MASKGNQREKRRQKKLGRQQQKKKNIKQAIGARLAAGLSAELPLYGCWVDDGLTRERKQGLATVVIARRMAPGKVQYAMFLVDRWALGLKDCFGAIGVSQGALDDRVAWIQEQDDVDLREADFTYAQQLIWGGIRYAQRLGFAPHPEFARWSAILGEPPVDLEISEKLFGRDGEAVLAGDIDAFARQGLAGFDADALDAERFCTDHIERDWLEAADDPADDPPGEARLWLAKDRLVGLLRTFAMGPPFVSLHFDAALRFTEGGAQELGTLLNSTGSAAFIDWFIHDYPLPSGGHVIDLFIDRIGPQLPAPERVLAATWRTSTLSVWQAQRIVPGEGLEFENLLFGGTVWVRDISLSKGAALWGVFVARLLPVGDAYTYFGGEYQFQPDDAARFIAAVETWEDERAAKRRSPSRTEIVKSEGYKLYGIARDLVEYPDAPALLTPEGDPLEFSFAAYRGERQALLDALGAITELERLDDGEAGAVPDFVWWEAPGDDEDDERSVRLEGETDTDGRRSLAHFTIKGDRLLITCMSWERLDRATDLLEPQVGAAIEFLDEAVLEPHRVLEAGSAKAALAAHPEIAALLDDPKPSKAALDPETKHRLEVEFKAKHYGTWPDEPLPALAGKTPRQAVRTAEGRAQVEALLRSMEYSEGRLEPAARYDMGQLRRALGLRAADA